MALLPAATMSQTELNDSFPAPNPTLSGRFGWSLAIDGDFALIGEPGSSFANIQEAHVLERVGGFWTLDQSLTPAGLGVSGFASSAVDIDGAVAVVGASNTDPDRQGAAVIFERVDSANPAWIERTQMAPLSGGVRRRFGHDVSLDSANGLVLIGAPGAAGSSLDPTVVGSAFLFARFDDRRVDYWNEVVEIAPLVPLMVEGFGTAVSLVGDLALVGSPLEDDARGAVYVFARDQGGVDAWGQVERLTLADGEPGDLLGVDLALAVSTDNMNSHWLVAGAAGRGTGSVILFKRAAASGVWSTTQELVEQPGVPGPFGVELDLDGDTLVVGNTNGVSVLAGAGADTGVISVFRRMASSWTLVQRYRTPGVEVQGLGFSVAVSGDTVWVGAPLRDVNKTENAGSAYSVRPVVFVDGFESGGVAEWSSAVP